MVILGVNTSHLTSVETTETTETTEQQQVIKMMAELAGLTLWLSEDIQARPGQASSRAQCSWI